MMRIGLAGWAYADWDGRVYPRPRPRGFDPLAWLAHFIDLMEVNSTFYALPQAAVVARWIERVSAFPNFAFTLKLHEELTHGSGPTPEHLTAWKRAVAPLAESERLRALLAQFPFSFRPSAGALERLIALKQGFSDPRLVFELRRREWFEPPWRARLVDLGLDCVDVDLPPHPQHPDPEPVPGNGLRYLRLHGRNASTWFDPKAGRDARYDHRYLPEEIREVHARLVRIARLGTETVLVANNHYAGKAVAAALALKAAWTKAPVAMPPPLLETYPDLAPLARIQPPLPDPGGQLPLFG